MKSNSTTDKDYELWVLLHQTRDALFKAREIELSKVGITAMQAAVLFIIKAIEGPASPAEIARWLYREHHSVLGILDRMERNGLVKKKRGGRRKNTIIVELTKKGADAYSHSRELVSIHNIIGSLSKAEKDNFRGQLEKLRSRALIELTNSKKTTSFPFP